MLVFMMKRGVDGHRSYRWALSTEAASTPWGVDAAVEHSLALCAGFDHTRLVVSIFASRARFSPRNALRMSEVISR